MEVPLLLAAVLLLVAASTFFAATAFILVTGRRSPVVKLATPGNSRALGFGGLRAHHLMVPRTKMVTIPRMVSREDLLRVLVSCQHSRYPVYDGTPDNIVGILSSKRLLGPITDVSVLDRELLDVTPYLTLPLFVPEGLGADQLLAQMTQQRCALAIVVDEYGQTAGVVTVRAVLDRLPGEAAEESEEVARTVTWLPDGSALVDGLALLSDVERELRIVFGDTDHDTLGGFIFGHLGRRPRTGDEVEVAGHSLVVEAMSGLRIAHVRVVPRAPSELAELLA